jgi:hypothetical protein
MINANYKTGSLLCLLVLLASGSYAQKRPVVLTSGNMYPYSVVRPMDATNGIFHPVYEFGTLQDTVNPVSSVYLPPDLRPDSSCMNRAKNDFRDALPNDFAIGLYLQDTLDTEYSPYGQDSMSFYISFPVIVTNQSPDTLFIGYSADYYSGNVALILEGKDEAGNWMPLETRYNYWDKTDKALVLPGGQAVVTSAFFYSGSFETDLRLRLEKSYSEVFRDWVNPEAFTPANR